MRPYEAAVIFDATLEDTIIRETTDQVVEFVRSRGGTTGRVDRWGRRTFAYPLKHRTEGYYVFIELAAEPPLVKELDRMLTLSDDVLRHRVIRQSDTPPSRPSRTSGGSERRSPEAMVPSALLESAPLEPVAADAPPDADVGEPAAAPPVLVADAGEPASGEPASGEPAESVADESGPVTDDKNE